MKKHIRRILLSAMTLVMLFSTATVLQTVKADNSEGIEVSFTSCLCCLGKQ